MTEQKSEQHWPLWEVFIRSKNGLSHRHAGSLHATDATMALQAARDKRIEIVPIWTVANNAAEAIANAARALEVDAVVIGASQRSAFYHMLRGHVVKGLMKKLPRDTHLMIIN